MTNDRAHTHLAGRHSRREFMRRSALLAGAGAATPWVLDLAGIGAASALAAPDDYRAIVCVFMLGGNDQHNTFVPTDSASRAAYDNARGDLAIATDDVHQLDALSGFEAGRSIGLAPALSNVHELFGRGDAAVIANVGSLLRPITKSEYNTDERLRPPALFSHNDQQSFWQASAPEGASTGWGGRLGDLLLDDNGEDNTFTCISAAGNAVMLSGRNAIQFHVSAGGVIQLDLPYQANDVVTAGLSAVMRRHGTDPFSSSYAQLVDRALDSSGRLASAVAEAPRVTTPFPLSDLGSQLASVAQQISAGRSVLGLKRQVFFVATGGYDTHDKLGATHPALLADLDASLGAFYDATVELGLRDSVTTFTASDFGRTLTTNGDGTDHGWGAHHLVIGGAVNGQRSYGTLPIVASNGPDDVGKGRLIPTISTDQYAATLATWMGASDDTLISVVPNIDAFPVRDLGFLTPSPIVPPTTTTPTTTGATTTIATTDPDVTDPTDSTTTPQPSSSSTAPNTTTPGSSVPTTPTTDGPITPPRTSVFGPIEAPSSALQPAVRMSG